MRIAICLLVALLAVSVVNAQSADVKQSKLHPLQISFVNNKEMSILLKLFKRKLKQKTTPYLRTTFDARPAHISLFEAKYGKLNLKVTPTLSKNRKFITLKISSSKGKLSFDIKEKIKIVNKNTVIFPANCFHFRKNDFSQNQNLSLIFITAKMAQNSASSKKAKIAIETHFFTMHMGYIETWGLDWRIWR